MSLLLSLASADGTSIFIAPTYPSAYSLNMASGNTDLYTVPASRKAYFMDIMVTNDTGGAIAFYPQVKIGGTYYQIGNTKSEPSLGIGHNYALSLSANQGGPIVLNAGETVAINTDTTGLSAWCLIIEFAASSLLSRADITSWSIGNNTLLTVPANKTLCTGSFAPSTSVNQPVVNLTSVTYRNNAGANRILSAGHIVPNAGSPTTKNQVQGSNTIVTGGGFSKFWYGNVEAGATYVMVIDVATGTQIAWINYLFI